MQELTLNQKRQGTVEKQQEKATNEMFIETERDYCLRDLLIDWQRKVYIWVDIKF